MFKWPVIVLLALPNLGFFILLMSLEETLSPITKGKLSITLSSYSCQSKFVGKALKFLTITEIPASFRCNLLLFNSIRARDGFIQPIFYKRFDCFSLQIR